MEFFAYLDPSSGSIILQAIIGGVLGTIAVTRNSSKNIKAKVKTLIKKKKK